MSDTYTEECGVIDCEREFTYAKGTPDWDRPQTCDHHDPSDLPGFDRATSWEAQMWDKYPLTIGYE